jgi:chaperonin GroEL
MENILFNENAQSALIKGVNLIGEAVSTTFGPNGRNVIIKGSSNIYITKDGATVARYVEDNNPFVNAGIDLIKGIATKTATDVGDGTTTATILAQSLINSLKGKKENPITISRELEKEVKTVIEYLEKNKKTITSVEDLIKVATISTNNDVELGKLIAETYFKVTKDGVVNVEDSQDANNSVVFSQGIKLETGYNSPYFINTNKNTCELENVIVGIFRIPLTEIKEIDEICGKAIRDKKSLLLIAPKIDSTILRTLIQNNSSGNLKSCYIPSPGHGIYRETLLCDIENIMGETMLCDKVIVSKDNTILIGTNNKNQEIIDANVDNIKKTISNSNVEFDINFNRKRLANYIGGIATIFVGGFSQIEIQEKKDRIEDALCAVKAAMNEGILPGGGMALLRASLKLELKYLTEILKKPNQLLQIGVDISEENSWLDLSNFWEGINLKTSEKGNMYEMGIVDPFLVTKIALENAVSVASLILTNGCAIITN